MATNLNLIAKFKTVSDRQTVTMTQWALGTIGRHLDELAQLDSGKHEWFMAQLAADDVVDLTKGHHVASVLRNVNKALFDARGK